MITCIKRIALSERNVEKEKKKERETVYVCMYVRERERKREMTKIEREIKGRERVGGRFR